MAILSPHRLPTGPHASADRALAIIGFLDRRSAGSRGIRGRTDFRSRRGAGRMRNLLSKRLKDVLTPRTAASCFSIAGAYGCSLLWAPSRTLLAEASVSGQAMAGEQSPGGNGQRRGTPNPRGSAVTRRPSWTPDRLTQGDENDATATTPRAPLPDTRPVTAHRRIPATPVPRPGGDPVARRDGGRAARGAGPRRRVGERADRRPPAAGRPAVQRRARPVWGAAPAPAPRPVSKHTTARERSVSVASRTAGDEGPLSGSSGADAQSQVTGRSDDARGRGVGTVGAQSPRPDGESPPPVACVGVIQAPVGGGHAIIAF